MVIPIVIAATTLLFACGNQENNSYEPNRIIGNNDLVVITKDHKQAQLIDAFGKMEIGCTTTHIGNGIVLTAGHCIRVTPFAGRLENQKCKNKKFNQHFGVTTDNPEGTIMSTCSKILVAEHNSERDYAILQVQPIPPKSLKLNTSNGKLGTKISIYSYPRARPLEWSTWCQIDHDFNNTAGHMFGYVCDTEGGSSGAAVINEDYEVIGIHNFYDSTVIKNGGTWLSAIPLDEYI